MASALERTTVTSWSSQSSLEMTHGKLLPYKKIHHNTVSRTQHELQNAVVCSLLMVRGWLINVVISTGMLSFPIQFEAPHAELFANAIKHRDLGIPPY